jgi:hypothetical protein
MMGSFSTWLGQNFHAIDPIVAGIAFYGGAIVVVVSFISFSLDVRKKWKERNKWSN